MSHLSHLRTFLEAYRSGSFSKAAELLGITLCLVPSPEFSQAPWYSLPDHLCRFGVRFDVT